MTDHTDRRSLTIRTTDMTVADLAAFVDAVRRAVPGTTPVTVTHRNGLFAPPETILVEIPTLESADLGEGWPVIERDDEHPDLDPDVPVVDASLIGDDQ